MKITQVVARELYNSRGEPTVSCELQLEDGSWFSATAPSGISCGSKEAMNLVDQDKKRLQGKGMLKAIDMVERVIGPAILGKQADLFEIDRILMELDGSVQKEFLGANSTLSVSLAAAKAQAVVENVTLYELFAHLHGLEAVSIPFPLVNVLNGGLHADTGFPIQEIMLAPIGFQNFRSAFEATTMVFFELRRVLEAAGKICAVGDEGGYAVAFSSDHEPFDVLMEALEKSGYRDFFALAMDVAASSLYDHKTDSYRWGKEQRSAAELLQFYQGLLDRYPIFSLEDGLSEHDWQGWKTMYHLFSDRIQIVGDDIFATNPALIERGAHQGIANSVVIKPNQIGTLSETLQAIKVCQEHELNIIISHRSGETNEDYIADLAVGTSAGQIKAGGCCRGERIAKYNRLLCIEDALMMSLLGD